MNMQKWLEVGIAGLVTLLAVQGNGAPPVGAYHGVAKRYTTFGKEHIMPVCGTFSLNTTARGRTTAKVVLRERTLSFKAEGWQDVEGTPYVRMESRGGEVLVLTPFILVENMVGTLSGGSLGDETMYIVANYNAFADRTDAAAQARLAHMRGYYTVALYWKNSIPRGAAEEDPWGNGYLTMTVGGRGKVKIAGVLADGTKVSQASTLMTTSSVPFFRPLYKRRGEIGGLIEIDPDTRTVVSDSIRPSVYWDKLGNGPDGFQTLLDPVGAYFSKGMPLPEPSYWLYANRVTTAFHLSIGRVWSLLHPMPWGVPMTSTGTSLEIEKGIRPVLSDDGTHYVYTGKNSSLTTLRYSPQTGIFRGRFNLYCDYNSGGRLRHTAVKVPFAGVMLQTRPLGYRSWPAGAGFYLVQETDPAFRSLRIKRSFWIHIYDYDLQPSAP